MPNDSPWWRRPGVHLRHDAHRWIRHDAARFVRPGFDPADVFPTLARKAQPAPAPAFDDELAADIAAARRVNHAMQDALNEVRAELARWRALDAKYSPTQPRVPAGNPRGGQWTDRSGGQGTGQVIGQDTAQGDLARLTQPIGSVDIGDVSGSSELGDLFRIGPDGTRVDGVQLAGEPVDLLEQELRGGHAIREHTDMTYDYLKSRSRDEARRTVERGDDFRGFSVGSFTSIQSANRLVNSTISENQDRVDQAIRDGQPSVLISKRFSSPTGYEAYLARAHAEPYIRDTFSVEVVIRSDPGSVRGWRVHTAYPVR
jgi:hypothetical protein